MKPHPTREHLCSLYRYVDDLVYDIGGLPCVGGLERKSGRTLRDHCFIGVKNPLDYIAAYVPGHRGLFQLHRLVHIYHFGDIEDGLFVDHINHVPYDNRISNLRLATPAQNQQNRIRKRKGKAGTIGVIQQRDGSFSAFVSVRGKPKYLGRFATEVEAIAARREAAVPLYGEFYTGK